MNVIFETFIYVVRMHFIAGFAFIEIKMYTIFVCFFVLCVVPEKYVQNVERNEQRMANQKKSEKTVNLYFSLAIVFSFAP